MLNDEIRYESLLIIAQLSCLVLVVHTCQQQQQQQQNEEKNDADDNDNDDYDDEDDVDDGMSLCARH